MEIKHRWSMEIPHKWSLVKTTYNGEVTTKIFASWCGGYISSDSWRLSSGIQSATFDQDSQLFEIMNVSGSVYICGRHLYGMSMYSTSIYEGMRDRISDMIDPNSPIEVMSYGIELMKEDDALKFLHELIEVKNAA